MGLSIGPTIGVDGAEKFQLAFKEMAASAGALQSQMDAVTASFRDTDSAMSKNKQVVEQLNAQIGQQSAIYDKAKEGVEKAKLAIEESSKAIEDSKRKYEAAVPVLQVFKAQYEESIAIQQRQEAVVAEVNARLQEAISVRDALNAEFVKGETLLQNEVTLHEQLIAKGSELVTTYNNSVKAYEQAEQAFNKNNAAMATAEEKHRTYTAQIEASNSRIAQLKGQQELLATAVKDCTAEVEKAREKVAEEQKAHGRFSEECKKARQERDEYVKVLGEFKSELSSVTREISSEEKALASLTKKDEDTVQKIHELEDAYVELDDAVQKSEKAFIDASDALEEEKKAAHDATAELEAYCKAHGEGSAEAQAAEKSVEKLTKQLDYEEKELSENKKETEAHWKALNKAKKEVDGYEKAIGTAEKRLDVAKITLQKWNDVMYTSKARLEELKKALEDAGDWLNAFGDDAIKMGENISEVGTAISKVLSPFTALTAFGVKGAMSFTDALAKISTIADTSKVSLEEFGDGIKKIASETGFATDDIAAATYQALSAAVETENSLEFVAGAADLARAGFLDMFGATDVLTTILNAYHKDVSEVAHISDVLVKVQDRGKTTVNELAQSMGNVIPTAAQYGIKLEDLGAAYVVLTKQGINTARTTTYLRSAFTELEKEGSDASEALRKATGKTFVQLLANGKSLGEIMQILKDYAHGDEEEFIHLFGSIRTAAGALALANTTAEEYAWVLDEVGNSNGQAARNVEKLQTPALKLKKIWEQLKTTGIDLGEQMLDVLLPALDKGAQKIKEFTEWFKSLHKSTKRGIAIFVGIAGAIGPMTVGIGKAIIGVGKFAKAMSLLFKATVPMIATFGGIATAVIAVAGALGALALKRNEAIEDYKDMIDETYGLTEEMKNHLEVTNDLIEANKNYRQATVEKAEATQAETALASGLLEQLRSLYDENGKVTEGNRLNAEIVKGQLADALNIEVEQIDTLIKKNGIFSDSIDNLIETQKKQAEAEVYLESYKEQYKTMVELQRQRKTVTDDMVAADKEWHDVMWQLYQAELSAEESKRKDIPLTQEQIARRMELIDAEEKSRESLATLKQSYDDINGALGSASSDMEFYIQKLMEVDGMTREEAEESAQKMVESITTVPDDVGTTVDDITRRLSGGYEAWKKDAEEYRKENQVNLQGVNTDTDTELTAYEDRFESARATVGTTVGNMSIETTTGLNSGVSGAVSAAGNIVDGFINELVSDETRRRIQEAYAQMAKWGDGSFKKEEEIKSPSKVWSRYADYIVDGHLIGLNNRMADVQNAYARLAYDPTADTSWTSNYSRLPDYAYGTTNNTRNISAPIAVNVNVNGNVDDPNGLADIIEQRLVEKIINNERAFA